MILGLDVGAKRVGIAISQGYYATEYTTLSPKDLLAKIADICQAEKIQTIVVGLPLDKQGLPTKQTDLVNRYVEELKKHIDVPIVYEDEELTTVESYRLMNLQAVSKQESKNRIDQFSAALILEQYLDRLVREQ